MTATRVATAAVLIPVVVAAVWWGPPALVAGLVGLVTVLALVEFFGLGGHAGLHGYRAWTCLCGLAVLFQQWAASQVQEVSLGRNVHITRVATSWQFPLELIFFAFILGIAAGVFASRRPLASALGDIGISAAGLLFIVLPASALVRLDAVAMIGPRLLLFTLVLVWAGDTLAYFAGRTIGRWHMAPQLSPGKTWEGAGANLLASLAVGALFSRWLHLDGRHVMAMAGLANIAGQAGDLLKSAYKRCAGVKDSGTLLPGHGGVLDRIDALLLAAPVVWYYFDMVLTR